MTLLLAGLALATHVHTFELDPSYTRPPFSGFEALVVEPSQVLSRLAPVAGVTEPHAQWIANEAAPRERALQFTNPTNTWAHFEVNGERIGTIGPYATVRMEGLKPGNYQILLELPNGYDRLFGTRVGPKPNVAKEGPVLVTVARDRLSLSDRIYFEFDSALIDPVSHPLLDAVAKALAEHPEVTLVSIEGHTDAVGGADYNQQLSESRAGAVRDYLTAKGIAADRLAAAGFGESRPVDAADSEEAHEQNRRVEFLVQGYAEPPAPVIEAPRRGSKKP